MIRHCVFIRFRPEVSFETKASIMDDIVSLKDVIAGILAVHVGGNVSPEAGMDKGYSNGFIVDANWKSAPSVAGLHLSIMIPLGT